MATDYDKKEWGVALLLILPLLYFGPWTMTVLWGWFVVPVFALPALGVAQALGLAFTISFMLSLDLKNTSQESVKPMTLVAKSYGRVLAALGLGWIIQLLV